jgi:hypothetical protein
VLPVPTVVYQEASVTRAHSCVPGGKCYPCLQLCASRQVLPLPTIVCQ